jgi:hypothetical protein
MREKRENVSFIHPSPSERASLQHMPQAALLPCARYLLLASLLAQGWVGCTGQTRSSTDRGKDLKGEAGTIIHKDSAIPLDARTRIDLTATTGVPCTYGKCAGKLICMANICRTMCSTSCGDKAPECPPDMPCYWASSFTSACLPGSRELGEECAEGELCKAGMLCVTIVDGKPPKCLKLYKYGCPPGTRYEKTNNGCEICL